MAPVVMVCSSLFFSCSKILDKEPEVTLVSTQVYRNVFDADAAIIGLYGKLMGLAKQYVVLNELRADLMDVTTNADVYLQEINTHSVSANNPYADPRPFYAVINDCNDILKNFNIMRRQQKFKELEYQQRYSDVGTLRSWLYLQLGIHFGQVPYVTDPLETVDAVKDQSKYPLLPFRNLLDSLIAFTEALPFKNPYPAGTNLAITVDASNTQSFFIEKNSFMGDLYLWKGSYDQTAYKKAATYYRRLMESTGYNLSAGSEQFYQQYKMPFANVTNNNDLAVGYIRFHELDVNLLVENNSQGWRSMFSRGQDALWNQEWIWVLPFNSNFNPVNPFIDLFSNNGGSYLVKPSQPAIDNWNNQVQWLPGPPTYPYPATAAGLPFDARGRFTWKMLGGQPVIMKYLYNYFNGTTLIPINTLQRNGQWFLNRAAAVHLHFAEAANRDGINGDGKHRLAYALVNRGIGAAFPVLGGATDVTPFQNTMSFEDPYKFDARQGDAPRFRSDWYRNTGIRGRANLLADSLYAGNDSTTSIENMIVNEGALELAYEGYRWPDLLRMAIRTNSADSLANKIYRKLYYDGNPNAAAVKAKLMNKSNWYLPFKFK